MTSVTLSQLDISVILGEQKMMLEVFGLYINHKKIKFLNIVSRHNVYFAGSLCVTCG